MSDHAFPPQNYQLDADDLSPHVEINDGRILTDLRLENLDAEQIQSAIKDGKIEIGLEGETIMRRIAVSRDALKIVFRIIAVQKTKDRLTFAHEKTKKKGGHEIAKLEELLPMIASMAPQDAAEAIEKLGEDERRDLLPELREKVNPDHYAAVIAKLTAETKESLVVGDVSADLVGNLLTFPPEEIVRIIREQVKYDREQTIPHNPQDKDYVSAAYLLWLIVIGGTAEEGVIMKGREDAVDIIILLGETGVRNVLSAPFEHKKRITEIELFALAKADLEEFFKNFGWEAAMSKKEELKAKIKERRAQSAAKRKKAAEKETADLSKKKNLDNV